MAPFQSFQRWLPFSAPSDGSLSELPAMAPFQSSQRWLPFRAPSDGSLSVLPAMVPFQCFQRWLPFSAPSDGSLSELPAMAPFQSSQRWSYLPSLMMPFWVKITCDPDIRAPSEILFWLLSCVPSCASYLSVFFLSSTPHCPI